MSTAAAPATPPAAPAAAALPPLETVSGSALLSELPEVNERAVSAAAPSPAAPAVPAPSAPAGEPIRDTRGTAYRPGFHRVKADGSPFTGKHGQFMPRGGRKKGLAGEQAKLPLPSATGSTVPASFPGVKSVEAEKPANTPPVPTITPEVVPDQEASVETSLKTFYHLTGKIFGAKGEWKPDDDGEHQHLKESILGWCRAKNTRLLSPGWNALLALLGYCLDRLARPFTSKRLLSWFPWLSPIFGQETEKPQPPPASEKSTVMLAPQPQPPARRATDNAAEFFQ